MRKIKFRGKRVDNDKWEYGYYIKFETRQCCAIGDDKLSDDEILHLIAKDGFADWNMPRNLEFTKVKKETIGQYTGLKDKNGNELFEGDLMKWTSTDTDGSTLTQIDEIKWSKYGWVCGKEMQCLADYLLFDPSYENLELFGNIHEVQHE